ncbi:MAG: SDR family NAD(P)-dependent oxidoreductase [Dehalococcoidales bacterium]|nr:SDR family NAD(P)-dependent oxidoreductase [Dehalococcoidales bacterium]
MDLGLKGKVAIVTGTSSQIGYGRGIVQVLAREGCNIVSVDMDLDGAKKTAAEAETLGVKAMALKTDIRKRAEVDDMIQSAIEEFGKIDILINNAGASSHPGPFINKTQAEIDADIDINLRGCINCCQAVLGHMISRKSGKIINVSSNGAKTGGAGVAVYCAAKAGVMVFTKSLSAEVIKQGINVNSIAPGQGNTGFALQAPPELLAQFREMIPIGRSTTPEDIGNMAAFLSSDVSADVVGQTYSVDGGLTMY